MKRIIEVEFVQQGVGMYEAGFYRIKGIPFLLSWQMIEEISTPYREDEVYKQGLFAGISAEIQRRREENVQVLRGDADSYEY